MSYNLQIWENPPNKPLPSNIDEAVKVVERLQESEMDQPNPKFMALAEKLKQKFPDITTAIPEEGEDEVDFRELAWPEAVEGDGLEAVWVLGLLTNDLFGEARDLVMQAANGLGLCVMDEQAGEVYLPGGKVLMLPGQANQQASTPANSQAPDTITVANKVFEIKTYFSPTKKQVVQVPPKNKELLTLAFDHIAPLMKSHGFKAEGKKKFTRDLAEGWCEIYLSSLSSSSIINASLSINIYMFCRPINEMIEKVEPRDLPPGAVREFGPTISVDSDKWLEPVGGIKIQEWRAGGGGYLIGRYDQIEALLPELTRKFTTVILPALDACQTLADFDHHLNPPGDNPNSIFAFDPRGSVTQRIIAAYLLNTPALESLCEKFGNWGYDGKLYVPYVRSHPLTKSN